MQEDAVAVLGGLHHVAGDLVGGELLHALGDLVLLAHGSPDIGVESVGALEQSLVLAVLDDGAGLLGDLAAILDDISGGSELLRAPADIVHAELGADVHQAVGHVVAGIAAENELALVEGLLGVLHQGEDVGERLGGMIDVGQTVPHGNTGVGGETLDDLLVVAAVLDAVEEAAEDLRGVDHGLLLAHLGGLGIEERDVRAFVIGGDLKRAAGAGGGLLEEQHDVLTGEQVAADAGALLRLQIGGEVEHIADLIGGEILQREKRTAFEINRHGIVLLQDSSPPMGEIDSCSVHSIPIFEKRAGHFQPFFLYLTANLRGVPFAAPLPCELSGTCQMGRLCGILYTETTHKATPRRPARAE